MKAKSILNVALASTIALSVTGCARNISPNTYASADVGEAVTTYEGVILSRRTVTVKEGEKFTDNQAGMIGGAVAGGILGSLVGGGRGSTLAALGGAVAGGAAGGLAQDKLSTQQAYEYTVRLNNGSLRTVVQGLDSALSVGQRVLIQVSSRGRSRVTPI